MKKLGLLHQETSVTPFTLGIMHRGFHQKMHHKYLEGYYFKNSIIVYKNNRVDWYADLDSFYQLSEKTINITIKNKNFSSKLLSDTISIGLDLFKKNNYLEKLNLKKVSNKQLANEIRTLYLLGNKICDLGQIAVFTDLRFYLFSQLLKNLIKDKLNKSKLKKSVNDYFSLLITPDKASYSMIESDKLHKLALVLGENNGIYKLFKHYSETDIINILKKDFSEEYHAIISHHKKFCWLTFGQLGPIKKVKQTIADLKKIINTGNIKNQIKKQVEERKNLLINQKKVSAELRLTPSEKNLFKSARDYSYNKIYRYDILLFTFFSFDRLLREIASRTSYNLQELRFLSPEEIENILNKKKIVSRVEIKKRQSFCVTIINGRGIKHLTGKEARLYLRNRIKIEKIKEDIMVLHGNVAFPGRARGIVKIVNSKNDLKKVNPGDILISIQTNPDLLPAMKIASAFVTDIGGITSHAAIVARELKKPCIIGTKIACKIFKDGDLADVDSTKGDIKKIISS